MNDEAAMKITVEERPGRGVRDCTCNADRERRVAVFLAERLRDVEGIVRIYSHRAGGRIDFTVEVDDLWGEASSRASEAFYDLYGSGLGTGVDTHVFPDQPGNEPAPENTIWLTAS